ncbi:hypothetical protein CcrC1_gp506 [Caulobacter phage C1]|nr:hypothetical protein CcrC1_gp013 [Caulobacter phage C1]UTU08241.1 hypothetical protein CcrC2_gp013 [Caulobacter phage C2]UTU08764.1 hypothetical protein CcrJ4_gp013 [Caulobacter phage J4]UTU09300.1 hypothetical protein CcrBL47_gp014 [Caulobacter phage BL47]UTU09876.1 hypothetical protein CcrRB23_gp014 [Caulobacter phage RB23]WGN96900.1 hypothetical protein [Bertelyvirus sp.]
MTRYSIMVEVQTLADSETQARKDVEFAIIEGRFPEHMNWMVRQSAPCAGETVQADDTPTRWATFVGQAWVQGHSMEVDDARVRYGITDAEFNANGGDEPADFDALAQAARAPQWVKDWSGPFDVYISDIEDGEDPEEVRQL